MVNNANTKTYSSLYIDMVSALTILCQQVLHLRRKKPATVTEGIVTCGGKLVSRGTDGRDELALGEMAEV